MNKQKLSVFIVACAMIPGVSLAAKNEDGEKIDLTAIEAAVSALSERVADLETELTEKQVIGDFVPTHTGTYDVSIVEMTAYGCGATTDFLALGTFEQRNNYFANQAISSIGYHTARTTATSDGVNLLLTRPYAVTEVETRLSGKAEIETNDAHDLPDFQISGNGTLSIDGFNLGSMSADGTTFQILGNFAGQDGDCTDTSATYIVGQRI